MWAIHISDRGVRLPINMHSAERRSSPRFRPDIECERREEITRAGEEMAASNLVSVGLAFVFIMMKTEIVYAQDSPGAYLDAHNRARAAVGVGPLAWSNVLAAYARNYANQRIGDCRLVHSRGPYGENLFWGSGKAWTATEAVGLWVSEKLSYSYIRNSCAVGKVCGHYTQIVWRNTRMVGCARVVCKSGAIFITCNYSPPGNYVGQRPY